MSDVQQKFYVGNVEVTAEMAQGKIRELIVDKGFQKKMQDNDVASRVLWENLNKIAAPGEIQVRTGETWKK